MCGENVEGSICSMEGGCIYICILYITYLRDMYIVQMSDLGGSLFSVKLALKVEADFKMNKIKILRFKWLILIVE